MSRLYLIRHGACEGLGQRLNGRSDGVSLTAEGREEVTKLSQALARRQLRAIWSSPRARCLQTADIIASAVRCPLEVKDHLDEVDFGAWTGQSLADLDGDPHWRNWNARRDEAQTPAGETMSGVQTRMLRSLMQAAGLGGDIALISHAEPIRAAVAGILSFSLRNWSRLAVSTASLTEIGYGPEGLVLLAINQTLA